MHGGPLQRELRARERVFLHCLPRRIQLCRRIDLSGPLPARVVRPIFGFCRLSELCRRNVSARLGYDSVPDLQWRQLLSQRQQRRYPLLRRDLLLDARPRRALRVHRVSNRPPLRHRQHCPHHMFSRYDCRHQRVSRLRQVRRRLLPEQRVRPIELNRSPASAGIKLQVRQAGSEEEVAGRPSPCAMPAPCSVARACPTPLPQWQGLERVQRLYLGELLPGGLFDAGAVPWGTLRQWHRSLLRRILLVGFGRPVGAHRQRPPSRVPAVGLLLPRLLAGHHQRPTGITPNHCRRGGSDDDNHGDGDNGCERAVCQHELDSRSGHWCAHASHTRSLSPECQGFTI